MMDVILKITGDFQIISLFTGCPSFHYLKARPQATENSYGDSAQSRLTGIVFPDRRLSIVSMNPG
jgi:hypothetical protein